MTTQLQELVSLESDPIIGASSEGTITLEHLLGYGSAEVLDTVSIARFTKRVGATSTSCSMSPDHRGYETQQQSGGRTIDIRLFEAADADEVVGSIGFFRGPNASG